MKAMNMQLATRCGRFLKTQCKRTRLYYNVLLLSYAHYAHKMARMYSDKVVGSTEYLAWILKTTMKPHLRQFTRPKAPSNFIVYYCLDVIAFLTLILSIALVIAFKFVRRIVKLIMK